MPDSDLFSKTPTLLSVAVGRSQAKQICGFSLELVIRGDLNVACKGTRFIQIRRIFNFSCKTQTFVPNLYSVRTVELARKKIFGSGLFLHARCLSLAANLA